MHQLNYSTSLRGDSGALLGWGVRGRRHAVLALLCLFFFFKKLSESLPYCNNTTTGPASKELGTVST